ncbi:hypothetical protein RSc0768 [Ralstonia pseudosolanacearum GMI1000]|uniref:Uncharacterized protein n=1 Tax=Ralstonia nicotianae (strain ATCC BAA-1114 / GMI1000) TaxID=267608 RepID=Q8Y1C2_RALN1|nr:hypothetical protein RSc0768 [Ralstonia pseudosolanacearum GMI1000]
MRRSTYNGPSIDKGGGRHLRGRKPAGASGTTRARSGEPSRAAYYVYLSWHEACHARVQQQSTPHEKGAVSTRARDTRTAQCR